MLFFCALKTLVISGVAGDCAKKAKKTKPKKKKTNKLRREESEGKIRQRKPKIAKTIMGPHESDKPRKTWKKSPQSKIVGRQLKVVAFVSKPNEFVVAAVVVVAHFLAHKLKSKLKPKPKPQLQTETRPMDLLECQATHTHGDAQSRSQHYGLSFSAGR